MNILSFNGRLQIAVDRMSASHPGAKLLEAQGTASAGLIEHPSAIDHLRVVFRDGETLLVIEETGYGEFDTLMESDSTPWPGTALHWPIDMDLPDADRLKEQYGYTDAYAGVALRVPQGVTWANASFVFSGNALCPDVFVDTVTGKVRAAS